VNRFIAQGALPKWDYNMPSFFALGGMTQIRETNLESDINIQTGGAVWPTRPA
jgi:hypothetical protein